MFCKKEAPQNLLLCVENTVNLCISIVCKYCYKTKGAAQEIKEQIRTFHL